MIFKRRIPHTLRQKTLNFIWPSMGLKRVFLYYKHRILRLPHSTRDIAMGLAAGCVVSWTPTLPFQILQCFIFCKMTRANFLASVVGTSFGNPWTFPVLFLVSYMVGDFVIEVTNMYDIMHFIVGDNIFLQENKFTMNRLIPTVVGGYVMAVITFPLFYYGFYTLITAGRASKRVVAKKVHLKKRTKK